MFRLVFNNMLYDVKTEDILIITSSGKLSNKLIHKLQHSHKDINILRDKTMSLKKMFYIFKNNQKLNFNFYLNLILNEIFRKQFKIKKVKNFKNKQDLLNHLNNLKPKLVFVFRGSYIFPPSILENFTIINIHCSDISKEKYRGLGGVYFSFIDKEEETFASMHKMETEIDSGDIISTKQYCFDFKKNYYHNENIAFDTGIQLLFDQLEEIKSKKD